MAINDKQKSLLNKMCPAANKSNLGDILERTSRRLAGVYAASQYPIPNGTPVNAVAASLTTNLEVVNAELVFTAKTKGKAGNDITITYVAPDEAEAELAVIVSGTDIIVNLATDVDKAVTTTASEVASAVGAHTVAKEMVTVTNKAENTGVGVVKAMAKTNLENGADGTVGVKWQQYIDDTYLYVAVDDNTINDTNWKRSTLSLESY